MQKVTKQEVKSEVIEHVTPLDKLIDVPDDDVEIEKELKESVSVINSEIGAHNKLKSLEYDLAVSLYINSLPRVQMKHLKTDNKTQAVKWDYWPFKMSKFELMEVIEELDNKPHQDFFDEARDVILAGVYEGMKPEGYDS